MKNFEKFKTFRDRETAFDEFCQSHDKCDRCPLGGLEADCCSFAWLDLEAEEEKPLPCPFCGTNTIVFHSIDGRSSIHCLDCHRCRYESRYFDTDEEAIAAHNRVARAVMEANKKGAKK